MGLRVARRARHPHPVRATYNTVEPVIGLQRIAPARHEIDDPLIGLPVEPRIGCGSDNILIEFLQTESVATRPAHDMLRQHIQRALADPFPVNLAGLDRCLCRTALQHFEPVRWHKDGPAGFIHPMIGPADALDQARGPFRRAHLDHEVHLAPVDAEIERGRTDHRLQGASRHRRLDLDALFPRE